VARPAGVRSWNMCQDANISSGTCQSSNVAATGIRLSPEVLERIDELAPPHLAAGEALLA
jgi:hypothetical protein